MLEKITSFITGIMVAIGGFFTPTPVQDAPIEPAPIQEESFGAFSPVAGGTYRLKTSIGTSDTTIILSAFTEPITGNPLTMTSLATDIGYATIDPQSSTRKEFVSFTGITQNADGSATLTGVSRGLGFQSPFTASSTLRKSHPGQSIFILSDSPQLFNEYARRRSNEIITGQWTFTTFPITPSTTPATATTSGQVELATGGEAASSTLTGDSGASLALYTGISTSSAPASGNVVVVTGDDGNIDSEFLGSDVNNRVSLTASTTFTGATLPQASYITASGTATTSNALSTSTNAFSGFVITNTASGGTATLQTGGVVSGFSGLTQGVTYWLTNTNGTISATPGTVATRVGIAISSTQILIQKDKRTCVGNIGDLGNSTASLGITCGFRPTVVRIGSVFGSNGHYSSMQATYMNGTIRGVGGYYNEATNGTTAGTPAIYYNDGSTFTFSVGSLTNTSFVITWTESGAMGAGAYAYYEAEE